MKQICIILSFFLFFTSIEKIEATVKLPAVFSNNMVLQQQSDVPFWGEASAKKKLKITTSWNNKAYETQTDSNGKWYVKISTPQYGGPFSIEISDGKKLTLENILIGEVWVCSGQSNMEMPLAGWGKVNNFQKEISEANYPNIRFLQVQKKTSNKPLNDMSVSMGGWVSCSPKTVAEFSAVAYFFGKNLFENKNIPVGLINTSWGGTIAEAWTSGKSLKTMPDFNSAVLDIEAYPGDEKDSKLKYEADVKAWNQEIIKNDRGFTDGKPVWTDVKLDEKDWKAINCPDDWSQNELSDYDGVVWLRKTIEIPAEWQNKQLALNLDIIDDNDITYFNGVEVGRTVGVDNERKYIVPAEIVKGGKAIICVRVFDTGGYGGIRGNAEKIKLVLSPDQFINLTGNWYYKKGVSLKEITAAPRNWNDPNRPSVLYNAMINPIVPFTIKGAIWYQGESNADKAYQYRELFPLMIKDWRQKWNINFPFYFVQLANFTAVKNQPAESNWAELREAQLKTLNLEKTGMAVTIDIGEANDIHPKNKQEVGRRLSLIALANEYGKKVTFSGPVYNSYRIEGSAIRIKFDNADGGLATLSNQILKGFSIAGLDHKFQWAEATIEGNEVVVTCRNIQNPIAVRYAWADNPICNLYNGAGLPASPFRTDDWQGNTYNRK